MSATASGRTGSGTTSSGTTSSVAVTAAGAGYVIYPHGTPPSPAACGIVEALPAEPDRIPLLVTPDLSALSDPVIAAIKRILAVGPRPESQPGSGSRRGFWPGSRARGRRWESVRLLMPHTGSPSAQPGRASSRSAPVAQPPPGSPVAAILASRLGCTVVAPAGPLWVVPGNSLLVRGGHGAGAWRTFTPDGRSTTHGSRFPSPPWEPGLLAVTQDLSWGASTARGLELAGERITFEEIPAGLWLRAKGSPPATAGDVAFAASARSDQFVILVDECAPSGDVFRPAASPAAVAELLRRLPERQRRAAIIVVRERPAAGIHGSGTPGVGPGRGPAPFGAAVASLLGEPVLASPGVPLRDAGDGSVAVTTMLGNGAGWRTFADLVEFRPGQDHPVVLASTPPLPGWPENDRGVWPLVTGWEVEVVQAGLWIRPAVAGDIPLGTTVDDPRRLPVDPAAPILAITTWRDVDTAPASTARPNAASPSPARPDVDAEGPPAAAVDQFVARLPLTLSSLTLGSRCR